MKDINAEFYFYIHNQYRYFNYLTSDIQAPPLPCDCTKQHTSYPFEK